MHERENNITDVAYEVSVNLAKARAVLLTTIENFKSDMINLTDGQKNDIVNNTEQIYSTLNVVDDYMYKSCKMLDGLY